MEARVKERLAGLLSVKSIVTLILTLVFAYLSVTGILSGEMFMTAFTVVIAFYFAKDKSSNKEG